MSRQLMWGLHYLTKSNLGSSSSLFIHLQSFELDQNQISVEKCSRFEFGSLLIRFRFRTGDLLSTTKAKRFVRLSQLVDFQLVDSGIDY